MEQLTYDQQVEWEKKIAEQQRRTEFIAMEAQRMSERGMGSSGYGPYQ